jgi:hypothetical protein
LCLGPSGVLFIKPSLLIRRWAHSAHPIIPSVRRSLQYIAHTRRSWGRCKLGALNGVCSRESLTSCPCPAGWGNYSEYPLTRMSALIANIVLSIHFLIAAFITLGFVAIPLGAWWRWRWVRIRGVRLAHLLGILFVGAESVLGVACPLTIWEDLLRDAAPAEGGFIARLLRALLYYDVPLGWFSTIYSCAAVVAVILWYVVPPAPWRTSSRLSAR